MDKTLKKKLIQLGIMIFVLIILVIAYFVLDKYNKDKAITNQTVQENQVNQED